MNQRFELAKAAMQGFCSNAKCHAAPADIIAGWSIQQSDALLSALNITPEAVVESQHVAAGVIKPEDEIESMRYAMAMHMLREIQSEWILALVPNTGNGTGEFWDVVRLDHACECIPYDGNKKTEHLWLIGRDKDPLNAVFEAGRKH